MQLTLTTAQARKLVTILTNASTQAQLNVLRDKRRANDSEHATIELSEQLVPQLRKGVDKP